MILLLLMTAGSIQKGECFYFCLTLEEGRGVFKARPEQRSHFWHLFVIQFDFSQISMTMPPILFWGLEMAKKGVSIAFLSSRDQNLDQKFVFWSF